MSCSEPVLINGVEDHVHILCNLSRTVTIAQLVEEAKKSTSKWMKEQGADCRDFFWQGGYGAFSVSQSNVEQVRAYIAGRRSIIAPCRFRTSFACCAGSTASRWTSDTYGIERVLAREGKVVETIDLGRDLETEIHKVIRLSKRATVFFSYASADRATADAIRRALMRHEFTVTSPEHFGASAQFFHNATEQAIKEAVERGFVLVLLSPASLASRWVKHETEYALRKQLLRIHRRNGGLT